MMSREEKITLIQMTSVSLFLFIFSITSYVYTNMIRASIVPFIGSIIVAAITLYIYNTIRIRNHG